MVSKCADMISRNIRAKITRAEKQNPKTLCLIDIRKTENIALLCTVQCPVLARYSIVACYDVNKKYCVMKLLRVDRYTNEHYNFF